MVGTTIKQINSLTVIYFQEKFEIKLTSNECKAQLL